MLNYKAYMRTFPKHCNQACADLQIQEEQSLYSQHHIVILFKSTFPNTSEDVPAALSCACPEMSASPEASWQFQGPRIDTICNPRPFGWLVLNGSLPKKGDPKIDHDALWPGCLSFERNRAGKRDKRAEFQQT